MSEQKTRSLQKKKKKKPLPGEKKKRRITNPITCQLQRERLGLVKKEAIKKKVVLSFSSAEKTKKRRGKGMLRNEWRGS